MRALVKKILSQLCPSIFHTLRIRSFTKKTLPKDFVKNIEKLNKIGIPIKNTNTNFILLYLPNEGNTTRIAEQFKLNRILVKNPFDKGCQKGWIRVTIGTLEDSERFIKVLKEILSIR